MLEVTWFVFWLCWKHIFLCFYQNQPFADSWRLHSRSDTAWMCFLCESKAQLCGVWLHSSPGKTSLPGQSICLVCDAASPYKAIWLPQNDRMKKREKQKEGESETDRKRKSNTENKKYRKTGSVRVDGWGLRIKSKNGEKN